MPCYRCGTRQVDPDRGESTWRRGVRADRQVLICPGCQDSHDWTAELDRCPVCTSPHLIRRLGETECRDCGSVCPPAAEPGAIGPGAGPGETGAGHLGADAGGDLAREVEQALARVLGRTRVPR
jgi:hypothetical protein